MKNLRAAVARLGPRLGTRLAPLLSLNDPNWGRGARNQQGRSAQGPPDLDDLWRNFNRRLNNLFGRRGGGTGGGLPSAPLRFPGGIWLIIGLVIAVWLASGFYIVVEGQRGVVLTFGKFSEETPPGLRWRVPWPVQSHEIVNLSQVRTVEVGYRNNVRSKVLRESLMLTDDENIVDLQFAVQYTIGDAPDYLFNVRRPDETAMEVAETAMREVIGKSRMDAILYETQEAIATRARELMQQIHDRYKTGVQVSTVTIQNAQPPEQVQAAFDDAVKAAQDRERQKNEGQAYANDVVPRAKGAAARLGEEAQGYRQRVIANAEGEAARFKQVLTEYSRAPAVTRERIYIETMQQILTSTSKVLVDFKGSGNLLYLPLDKLLQQTASPAPDAAPRPGTPEAAEALEPGGRSRDSLRGRERGDRP